MPGKIRRLLPLLSLVLCVSLLGVQRSHAQAAYTAAITAPDTGEFPYLTTFLDVHDPQGAFVHGLVPQDVTVLENDLRIPVSELQEQKPGVQFVLAINPGESFTIRDGLGVSRYEYLLQGILAGAWSDQPPGSDDLSLLTLGGPQLIHSSDPAEIRASLAGYLPEDVNVAPNLEVLALALQVASDPLERPGMERAILFITPPQQDEVSLGLQSIIASARQQNIRIFVWMVGAQEVFELPEVELLRNLAVQTNGNYFAFSNAEPVPDLEEMLDPLRYIYSLGYASQISTPGSQALAAEVTIGSELVVTEPTSFELELQAPALSLINLPDEIERTYTEKPAAGTDGNDVTLEPAEQVVNIDVTFPDGHVRPLERTSLYVDGTLIGENTAPPFDQFIWDLRSYTQDGEHTLKAEATDNLGIIGTSAETEVRITVPKTSQSVMLAISEKRPVLVGVVVVITASMLILILILAGRIRPKPHPGQVVNSTNSKEKTRPVSYQGRISQRKDLQTQTGQVASLPRNQPSPQSRSWKSRLPWFKNKEEQLTALAYLIPLTSNDEITLPAPLRITADDTSLGSDPLQAGLLISDPSVEKIHARIHHEGKSFLLTDAGSVAGTWVNYKLVPAAGIQLEHADIIHLGVVGFRFNLAEPEHLRTIIVTPLDEDR